MARQRVAIPFGGGLDRYTGPMVVDMTAQEDVRNVHLAEGWAHVRRGSVQVAELPGDVVAGEQLRTEDVLILVAYDADTREVHVYRAASDGTNALHIGKWFDLHESADEPPRVFMAEVAGLMFMAHDEAIFSRRAPTVYYDRFAGTLSPLEAEWAHEGGIRFRGITAHLGAYLAGWGYGTADEARPDLVRMSMPGEPTVFHPKFYEPIGQRGEAVIRCVSTGRTLVCFTSAQTWEHFGSDRSTFGARPADTKFGLAASRLAVEVDGTVYFWSRTGPRRTTGGLSEDLALPLELRGPAPADLAAEGALKHAFATFYPPEDEVLFVFGRRIYAYSLRTGRWRYDELPWAPVAAILSQPGVDVDPGYDPGFVANLRVVEDVAAGVLRDVTIEWDNVAMVGGEVLELWLHDGAQWSMVASVPVDPQGEQDYTFQGLASGKKYRWQIRGRLGALYREDYTSEDPNEWPEGSLLEYTTGLAAPAIQQAAWARTGASTESCTVSIMPSSLTELRLYRSVDGGETWTWLETVDPSTHQGNLHVYVDNTIPPEQYVRYRAVQYTADVGEGPAHEVERWMGPDAPANVQVDDDNGQQWYRYRLTWSARPEYTVEIEDDYECLGAWSTRAAMPSSGDSGYLGLPKSSEEEDTGDNGGPATFDSRIRHVLESFGVTDHSDWVKRNVVVRIALDETAYHACGGGGGSGGGGSGGGGDPDPGQT